MFSQPIQFFRPNSFDINELSVAQNWEEAVDPNGFASHPQLEHWFDPRFLVSVSEDRVLGWRSLTDPSVGFHVSESVGVDPTDNGPFLSRLSGGVNFAAHDQRSLPAHINAPFDDDLKLVGPVNTSGSGAGGAVILNGMTPIAPPYTVIAVVYNFDYQTSDGQKNLFEKIDGVDANNILYYGNVDRYCAKRSFKIADDGQPAVTSNGYHLIAFEIDTANESVKSYLNDPDNGYTETNTNYGDFGSLQDGMVLTPSSACHAIGEFGFFSGKLSTSDLTQVFNNIKTRVGIS